MPWDREREVLRHAIQAAGATALKLAAEGFEVFTKADQTPVTSADLAVNDALHHYLLQAFPDDGWLSEESPDNPRRLDKHRVWIIDPIDGTSAFVRREPEFCVSVALVELGRPVVAAVFNPSTGECVTATRGEGIRLNDQPVVFPNPADQPVIALSPWETQTGRFHRIQQAMKVRPMRSIAWAMALAACGRLEAVATLEPQNEWDIAAGALLVEEGAGLVTDAAGNPLRFNQPELRSSGMIATGRHCPEHMRHPLRSLLSPTS